MSLLVRAIAWFGIYLALVLLPLGLALVAGRPSGPRAVTVELAATAGFIGFSVFVLECVLVSRLRAAAEPFGTDALMCFHRLMGITAVGFLVAHPMLLAGSGVTPASFNPLGGPMAQRVGPIAFWVVVLMVISSIWRRRLRLRYEVWRGLHTLSALVIVPASVAHVVMVGGYSQVPVVAGTFVV